MGGSFRVGAGWVGSALVQIVARGFHNCGVRASPETFGRYASFLPPEMIARLFGTKNALPNLKSAWNMAPTIEAPVVRRNRGAAPGRADPGFRPGVCQVAEGDAAASQCSGGDGREFGDVPHGVRQAPLSDPGGCLR